MAKSGSKLVRIFLDEARERLAGLDNELLALERAPRDASIIAQVFRAVHTIKGSGGFIGLRKVETLAHTGEELLSKLRDGALVATPEIISALLTLADALRAVVDEIDRTGEEGDADHADLIGLLRSLRDSAPSRQAAAVKEDAGSGSGGASDAGAARGASDAGAVVGEVGGGGDDGGGDRDEDGAGGGDGEGEGTTDAAGVVGAEGPQIPTHDAVTALLSRPAETSIRVPVDDLDELMTLAGELVLARNQLLQVSAVQSDRALSASAQQLNAVTTALRERVMQTRMQPVSSIWQGFPRLVRDLGAACGKRVRLEVAGGDTTLDKAILDAIRDPLAHAVRNAIDHGIEAPEQRQRLGKPQAGLLTVRASHRSGQVHIEVNDDGAGIDHQRVKRKAVDSGLISAEEAERMGEREVLPLLFRPGLSTARRVTRVSGRGVGLDIVLAAVERVGGSVTVDSALGEGTTLTLQIPLTLAIIPTLIVGDGQQRYVIPQVNVVEIVRLRPGVDHGVERIVGSALYRLRDRLLPLVILSRLLAGDMPGAGASAGASGPVDVAAGKDATARGDHADVPDGDVQDLVDRDIVVVNAEGGQFGLLVERVIDAEEIVVKQLGSFVRQSSIFAGATILGDGNVALIVDVARVARRARVFAAGRSHGRRVEPAQSPRFEESLGAPMLLLRAADDGRLAVPLADVERLEWFPRSAVERTSGGDVVQYFGQIMPLIHLGSTLEERRTAPRAVAPDRLLDDQMHVVVFNRGAQKIGLVVEGILDIVSPPSTAIERAASRDGVLGTVVLSERVTEVLDLDRIVELAIDSSAVGRAPTSSGMLI